MRSWLFGQSSSSSSGTSSGAGGAAPPDRLSLQQQTGTSSAPSLSTSRTRGWSSYDLLYQDQDDEHQASAGATSSSSSFSSWWGGQQAAGLDPTSRRRQRALVELKQAVQALVRARVVVPPAFPPPPSISSQEGGALDGSSSGQGGRLRRRSSSERVLVVINQQQGGEEEGVGLVLQRLEQAVFLGCKRQDYRGVLPFWRMLHTIVHDHPWQLPASSQLKASYDAVRKSPECATASGKARLWLRKGLAAGQLHDWLAELTHTHHQVLECYYRPAQCVLLCPEGSQILFGLVASLQSAFAFSLPPAPPHATASSSSSSSSSSSAGGGRAASDSPLGLDKAVVYELVLEEERELAGAAANDSSGNEAMMGSPSPEALALGALEEEHETRRLLELRRARPALSFNESADDQSNDEVLSRVVQQVGLGLDRLVSFSASRAKALLTGGQGSSKAQPSSSQQQGWGRGGALASALCGERSLVQLVRDPATCRHALLQPALGVPQAIRELVDFLRQQHHLGCPGGPGPAIFALDSQDAALLIEARGRALLLDQLDTTASQQQQLEQQGGGPEGSVEPDTPPEVAASALLSLLEALPEPLLTYHYYDALLQAGSLCGGAASSEHGIRNLQILLSELPSEHKPTVALLLRLLHDVLKGAPDDGESSDRWCRVLAEAFSTAFLRTYLPPSALNQRGQLSRLLQTREEVEVCGLLIRHQPRVCSGLEAELKELQVRLAKKCARLQEIRAREDQDPLDCPGLVLELSRLLTGVDLALTRVSSVSHDAPSPTSARGPVVSPHLLQRASQHGSASSSSSSSGRGSTWSGLEEDIQALLETPPPPPPVDTEPVEEAGGGGEPGQQQQQEAGEGEEERRRQQKLRAWQREQALLKEAVARLDRVGLGPMDRYAARGPGALTLELMAYLLRRFPQQAALMVFKYGRQGAHGFARLSCAVARMVISLLRMGYRGPSLILHTCRSPGAWAVLSEEHGLHEVFCLAMVVLDFIAHHQPVRALDDDAYVLEVKRQLTWVMRQVPESSEEAWQLWLSVRLEKQRRFAEQRLREQQLQRQDGHLHLHSPPPSSSSSATSAAATTPLTSSSSSVMGGSSEAHHHEAEEEGPVMRPPVRVQRASNVLSLEQVQLLERALAPHHQGYRWELLYSLKEHGASLNTLFRRARHREPTMLVVQDTRGALFGGFATRAWRDKADGEYYGDGESWVWALRGGGGEEQVVEKHEWSGRNSYFMLSSLKGGLAFGGGGAFALLLDADLLQGSSGPCHTFDSPAPLASGESFECLDLELWGFATAFGT